jgi:hypothetical protein
LHGGARRPAALHICPSPALLRRHSSDYTSVARFGKFWRNLKVIWQAKNISGGLLISGGFLADLTNFVWFCFCLADLADSGGFGVSINKKQLFFSLFLAFLGIYYLPVNQK